MIGTMIVKTDASSAIQSLGTVGVTASILQTPAGTNATNEIAITSVSDAAALRQWLTDNGYNPGDYPSFNGLEGYME